MHTTSQYPNLLKPFRLRHVTFKNRVMSTSHAPGYVEDKHPKLRYQLYHEEKAKGGLALTMFGGSSNVAPDSPSAFGQIYIGDDSIIPVLREFSERVHRHGCAIMCQITHMGHRTLWNVGGLAASPRPLDGARARASLVPEGDGPQRHPPGGGRVRRRRVALQGRRARRHRAPRPRAPHPPVLDAARQPPHRRVRRKPREPGTVRPGGPGGGAPAGGRRLPRRLPDDGRRAEGGRPRPGGLPRAREVLRRHRHVRLHERDRRAGRGRARAVQGHPEHGRAARALRAHRGRDEARDRTGGLPRHPYRGSDDGRALRARGLRRHGGDDPRPHGGPAHRRQDDAGRRGSDPPLRRRRLLPRPHLHRRGRAVPAQPRDRARADDAARGGTGPRSEAQGRGGGGRTGGAGGGPGLGAAGA